ncbi:MAG: hypothetical protein ABEN55_04375, partial [Bradymonadaceae bacterium]
MLLLFYASGFSGTFTHELPGKLAPSFCAPDTDKSPEKYCNDQYGDCDGDETCKTNKQKCKDKWDTCTESRSTHPTSYTYTNYFIVGDGTVSSILDEVYEIRGTET